MQWAKKVVSDNPWLVNFAIKVVNSVLNLPDRQVKFFGILNYRRPAINPAHYFFFPSSYMLATNAAMKKWNMIIWCNITWLCCMALLLIVCAWYNQINDKGFFMVSYMYFYSGTVQDTTAYCWAILQDCIKNSPTPKASGEFGLSIFPEMSMTSFFWNLKLQILFTPNISLSKLLQYCDTLFLFIATVHVNI